MTRMSVGEFKANFSEALDLVRNGEEVEVLYGRAKEPVARLVPAKPRRGGSILGLLEGKATFIMSDNWKMTPEELLDL